jgi:glycosyltransferase involved in cell wall biosynthesis
MEDFFLVFYTDSSIEGHPWQKSELNHNHFFAEQKVKWLKRISTFSPDIFILAGVNKYTLFLFLYGKILGKNIIILTDIWYLPFSLLKPYSQKLRKLLYKMADHIIVTSEKGDMHIIDQGVPKKNIIRLPFTINPLHFPKVETDLADKPYDLLFSGRIVSEKLPLFFAEVAAKVNEIQKIRVLVLGDGELKMEMRQKLKDLGVETTFAGYLPQEQLQSYYKQCKLLLFPTEFDTWGIVANEALSARVPVIISPNAGAADDLIISGKNGFVLPHDIDLWTEKTIEILNGQHSFSFDSPISVETVADELLKSVARYQR